MSNTPTTHVPLHVIDVCASTSSDTLLACPITQLDHVAPDCHRDEPLVFMSSFIQPVGLEQHLQPGVSAWTFQDQQSELRCHMETGAAPYCVIFASGAIAAAGWHSFLLCKTVNMPCKTVNMPPCM